MLSRLGGQQNLISLGLFASWVAVNSGRRGTRGRSESRRKIEAPSGPRSVVLTHSRVWLLWQLWNLVTLVSCSPTGEHLPRDSSALMGPELNFDRFCSNADADEAGSQGGLQLLITYTRFQTCIKNHSLDLSVWMYTSLHYPHYSPADLDLITRNISGNGVVILQVIDTCLSCAYKT